MNVPTIATVLMASATMAASPGNAARAEAPAPRPFVATYEVAYRGLRAGTLTFEFQHQAASGRYLFETRAHPGMLARLVVSSAASERSVMEIGPNGVRPLEWRLDDGKASGKGDGELQFNWAQGIAAGKIEGEQFELPTEPGMQDRLSIQIAVSAALLRGAEPGVIPLIDDRRVKPYTYTRKENAVLESPLGKLDTVQYQSTRPGGSRVSRLWLAPQLDYAPVRAEQIRKGKVETVMVLTSWEMTSD